MVTAVAIAAASEWTLRDAVEHALAHNLELRSERLLAEGAEARLAGARAAFEPSLSGRVDATRYEGADGAASGDLSWSVGLAQPLPTGGSAALAWGRGRAWEGDPGALASLDASAAITVEQPLLAGAWLDGVYALRAAGLDAEAARIEREARAERLAVEVANAYWGLVSAREYAALAARSVEIAEEQLAQTRARFDEGFAGSGDVLQVERALGVSRQSREVAVAAEAAAERRLARLMGIPQGEDPSISPVDRPAAAVAPPDAETARAAATQGNASLRAVRLLARAAEVDYGHAVSGALPDLSVAGSLALSAGGEDVLDDPDRAWALGASLSVPITPRGPLAEVREARLARDRVRLAEEAAQQDVLEDLDAALHAVARDRSRVDLAEVTLSAAEQGLAADRELYTEGRGSTRDVVRSLEALEEAQLARLRAEIDLQASVLELARLQGKVLEALGVAAPD
ncbi:MAG: TolC family protein [Myxococcota bacterium]